MRNTATLAIFLAGVFGITAPSPAVTINEIVGQVCPSSYSNWLANLYAGDGEGRGFTTSGNPRIPDPAYHHDLARDSIFASFAAMGYETWLDPFGFSHSGIPYANCNNVVAVKRGAGGTNVFIVGAHYDSVDATQQARPGADDNASGVAGLLEAARVLQDFTFRDTFVLIAFDAEETGNYGSTHFATQHTTANPAATNATVFYRPAVKGMVSADMIAYNGDSESNLVSIYGGSYSTNAPVRQALVQAIVRYTANEPVNEDWTWQSDHDSFQLVGIDSALLIEYDTWANPYYHSQQDSTDTPGYINPAYAAENTKALAGFLCDQARIIPPATLAIVRSGGATRLEWAGTPGVAYTAYGAGSPDAAATWQAIGYVAATNDPAVLSVEVGTSATHRYFKVLGE